MRSLDAVQCRAIARVREAQRFTAAITNRFITAFVAEVGMQTRDHFSQTLPILCKFSVPALRTYGFAARAEDRRCAWWTRFNTVSTVAANRSEFLSKSSDDFSKYASAPSPRSFSSFFC